MLGAQLGNYTITSRIGDGTVATVYRAEHAVLGRPVAVKLLHDGLSSDRELVGRFFSEAHALATIRHPGSVDVFDFGFDRGRAYIAMELIAGETLAARRERRGRLPLWNALVLTRELASTLIAAHELGMVHRKLTPEKVLLVPDATIAGGDRTKLSDFASAGSPDDDAREDLYALGCVLYELLFGQPPCRPALPTPVEALVMSLVDQDPAVRPQTAAAIVAAIDTLLHQAVDHKPCSPVLQK